MANAVQAASGTATTSQIEYPAAPSGCLIDVRDRRYDPLPWSVRNVLAEVLADYLVDRTRRQCIARARFFSCRQTCLFGILRCAGGRAQKDWSRLLSHTS